MIAKIKAHPLLASALIFFFISVAVVASTPKIFGFDSLYHIRHAWLYQTEGIFFTDFPWVSASVIDQYSADIWYGFHILLIPFTFFGDLLFGVRLAIVVSATTAMTSFFWLLRYLNIRYPLFWSSILLISTADFFFRLFMSRPHIISLFLSFLILGFLVKNKNWPLFITTALLAFIHISLIWVPILILIVSALSTLLVDKKIQWKNFTSIPLGIIIGSLLHPNFINTLKVSYVQIVQLFITKEAGVSIKFGRELLTLTTSDVTLQYLPLFLLILGSLITLIFLFTKKSWSDIKSQDKKTIIISGILTIIFLILAFVSARRSTDFLSGFAILFAASITSTLYYMDGFRRPIEASFAISASIVIAVLMFINGSWVFNQFIINTQSPEKFKEASLWLRDNTNKGDIVFNSYWDNFPNLFFWNTNNYYISGMDPIFQYSFSEDLYWKAYFIAYRGQPFTCGLVRCTEDDVEDIGIVLKRDFNASYMLIEHRRSRNLYGLIEEGEVPGFEKVFETNTETIYKISPLES